MFLNNVFCFCFLNVFTWKYFVTIFKDYFSNMGVNSMGYSIKFGRGCVGGGGEQSTSTCEFGRHIF